MTLHLDCSAKWLQGSWYGALVYSDHVRFSNRKDLIVHRWEYNEAHENAVMDSCVATDMPDAMQPATSRSLQGFHIIALFPPKWPVSKICNHCVRPYNPSWNLGRNGKGCYQSTKEWKWIKIAVCARHLTWYNRGENVNMQSKARKPTYNCLQKVLACIRTPTIIWQPSTPWYCNCVFGSWAYQVLRI